MMWKLDLGDEVSEKKPLGGRPTISILIGAGFSVPMGYPIGNRVNDILSNFDYNRIDISPAGELYNSRERSSIISTQYQRNLVFCGRMIDAYTKAQDGKFDYEEFFDFIHSKEIFEESYLRVSEGLVAENEDYHDYVYGLDNIFTQMVSHVIRDGNGEIWYDNKPNQIGFVKGYDTFLQVLSKWSDDYIVNVHTLNHDMLFESFNKTEYLSGKICDGFDEYGSEYYGVLTACQGRRYNVRLERYTARYNKPVRLYKLHGSFDYVFYYKSYGNILTPSICVKRRYGIDLKSLKRGIGSKMKYESFPFAYHSNFLSGVNTKVKHYNDKVLYCKLQKRFRNNLRTAKQLIIVGYGGKDEGINDAILDNYDYHIKPTIIIDPYPSDALIELKNKLGASLITKSISDISKSELALD